MPRSMTARGAATAVALLGASPAWADDVAGPAAPNLVLLHAAELAPELRTELGRQLRAALAGRKLTLCLRESEGAATDSALAGVDVTVQDRGAEDIVVTVTVRDDLTAKRVSRD